MWQTGLSALAITACLASISSAQVGIRLSVGGSSRGGSSSSRGGISAGSRLQSLPSIGRQRVQGGTATPQRGGSGYGGALNATPLQRRTVGPAPTRNLNQAWTPNGSNLPSRVQGAVGGGRPLVPTPSVVGGQVGQRLQPKDATKIRPGQTNGSPAANLGQQVIQNLQPNGLKQGIKEAVKQELIQNAAVGAAAGTVLGEASQKNGLGRKLISDAIQEMGISGKVPNPHPGDGPGGSDDHPSDSHPHHHGHHHSWFVIQWVPTFFAPPVQRCPEPPVVVCPPPAPLCPPPGEVVIAEPPVTPDTPAPDAPPEDAQAEDGPPAPGIDDTKDSQVADGDPPAPAIDGSTPAEQTNEPQSGEVDLQVEYVQVVDGGSAEQQQGPLYRIWIVNHGTAPVVQPFDVVLVASNEDAPPSDAPYAAQRVARIEAGARLSVEIRLPVEVLQMGVDAEGLPVPFKNLFAAVDIQQELVELNEQNNALGLARKDVPDAAMLASSK